MGEIAEMVFEGILCETCGVYIDDSNGGYPRKCEECEANE